MATQVQSIDNTDLFLSPKRSQLPFAEVAMDKPITFRSESITEYGSTVRAELIHLRFINNGPTNIIVKDLTRRIGNKDIYFTMRWQDQDVTKKDGTWTVDGNPLPSVTLAFQHSPSNMPEHYYLGLKVKAPVGSATPPHTHGGAAIIATMIKGQMLNQMVCPDHDPDSQGSGPIVHSAGDSWYEPPGCHHVRSENVGEEEAEFLAVLVVHKEKVYMEGLQSLVVIDAAVDGPT